MGTKEIKNELEKQLRDTLSSVEKEKREYRGKAAIDRFHFLVWIKPDAVSIGDFGIILSVGGILVRPQLWFYRFLGRCQQCGKLVAFGRPFRSPVGMKRALEALGEKITCFCFLCKAKRVFGKRIAPSESYETFIELVSSNGEYLPPAVMLPKGYHRWWKNIWW